MVKLSLRKTSTLLVLISFCLINGATIGEYGGAHLRMPVGTRAFAMGGAQSADPQNNLVWWNPANLSLLKEKQLTLGGEIRPFGRTGGYLTMEAPIKPRAGLSASIMYRGDPTLDNLKDEQEYDLEDGRFTTITAKVGISYLIVKKVSLGINVSLFYQKLPSDYYESELVYSDVTKIGGFDLGINYALNKKLNYGLVFKQILASMVWNLNSANQTMQGTSEDNLPLIMTLGQQYKGAIKEKPFIWTMDLSAYLIDSKFKQLRHGHLLIDNGFEWQRWDTFFIRLGIGDFELNTEMFEEDSDYGKTFSLNYTAGFALNLQKFLANQNFTLNYGIAIDKAFAGVDQQLEILYKF